MAKLVYLDAAYDHASDQELFDRLRSQFSLSPIKVGDPYLSAIFAGSNRFHPDYAKVMAPALSFHVNYDAPPAYVSWNETPRMKFQAYWKEYGHAFSRGQMERFRTEVRHAKVVAVHNTNHSEFLTDPRQRNVVVSEMRSFLARH